MPSRKITEYDAFSRAKTRSKTKLNCDPVKDRMRYLWNKGKSRDQIAILLKLSSSSVDKVTKNWKARKVSLNKRRSFDYNIAYCLLFEHGLTYRQAAFALEVKERSLREIIRRNRLKIEETHDAWKVEYAALYQSWKPKVLYGPKIAAKLRHEKQRELGTSNLRNSKAMEAYINV